MKTVFATLGAAALMVTGAAAQNSMSGAGKATVANPTSMVKNFDESSLGPVLSELGITWQASQFDTGTKVILANAFGDIIFYAVPTACRSNTGDCVGVQFFAIFEGDANPQTVRAFNDQYAFTQTSLERGVGASISRYEIADYGIPRGNIAASLKNFLSQAAAFRNALAESSQTVALEGYADDLSAAYLNRVGLQDFAGVEAHADAPFGHGDLLNVEMKDRIVKFISAKNAPRNKIDNITRK